MIATGIGFSQMEMVGLMSSALGVEVVVLTQDFTFHISNTTEPQQPPLVLATNLDPKSRNSKSQNEA